MIQVSCYTISPSVYVPVEYLCTHQLFRYKCSRSHILSTRVDLSWHLAFPTPFDSFGILMWRTPPPSLFCTKKYRLIAPYRVLSTILASRYIVMVIRLIPYQYRLINNGKNTTILVPGLEGGAWFLLGRSQLLIGCWHTDGKAHRRRFNNDVEIVIVTLGK